MSDNEEHMPRIVLAHPQLVATLIGTRTEAEMRRRVDAGPDKLEEIAKAAGHSAHAASLQVSDAISRLDPELDTAMQLRDWLQAEHIGDHESGPAGHPNHPPVGPDVPRFISVIRIAVAIALAKAAQWVLGRER